MMQLFNSVSSNQVLDPELGKTLEIATPPGPRSVRWIDSIGDLEAIKHQWDELSENAIWRNPSFEHNYLIPAFKHLGDGNVRVLVVEDSAGSLGTGGKKILGLLPIVKKTIYHLPIPCLEVWKHDQCFDTTPLISKHGAAQTLSSIFDFLAEQKVGLLSLDTFSAEPDFQNELELAIDGTHRSRFQRDSFARAALRPVGSTDDYVKQFVSKSVLKNCNRLKRRLAELGDVSYELADEFADHNELAQQFMEIEASGWKMEAGTALASNASTVRFYEELIFRSAQEGKARFVSLKLDGRPIAMLSDILTGQAVYSYKTAFDEKYSAFSPGVQLEMKHIEYMHNTGIELADSCTDPENATINRIWGQTLQFQSVVIGLRPGISQWATQIMPWFQAVANKLKRFKPPTST